MSYYKQLPYEDRCVITAFIKDAFANGATITVNDGEEDCLKQSSNFDEITEAMCSTDEDYLKVYIGGDYIGWGRFIYGNEPGVVLSDNSVNEVMDRITQRASDMAVNETYSMH